MAITARLGVDFGPFFDAVQKANITLKGFEDGAGSVSKKLDAMANSFSGQKVFQQATIAQKAIEDIGGVTQLTTKEQARLNAVLEEALQKYKAIGVEAPPGMQALADATKQSADAIANLKDNFDIKNAIEHPIDSATDAMRTLGASMGPVGAMAAGIVTGIAAVGAVLLDLTSKAAELGSKLNDMSQKSGIVVPTLSRLAQAAQVAGSDVETLANAIYKMDIQAADSPDKFSKGLEKLGLNTKEFLALDPASRLEAFAAALNNTSDSATRNAAGAEIMGKQFKDLGPVLLKLNEAMTETAGISVWTDAQAKDAEQFQMQMTALKLEVSDVGIAIGRDLLPAGLQMIEFFKDAKTFAAAAFENSALGKLFHVLGDEVSYASAALDLYRGKLPGLTQDTDDAKKALQDHVRDMQDWAANAARNEKAIQSMGGATQGLVVTSGDLDLAWKELSRSNADAVAANNKAAAAAKQHAAELTKQAAAAAKVTEEVHKLEFGFYGLSSAAESVGRSSVGVLSDFDKDLMKSYDSAKKVESGMYGIGTAVLEVGKTSKPTMADLTKATFTWSAALGSVSDILGHVGGQFGQIAGIAARAGKSIIDNLASGNVWGAVIAGATAAVEIIGKLWDKVRQIFGGPSKDELAARDEFAKSFDSTSQALDVLSKQLSDAGHGGEEARVLIQALFDATHVSAAAVDAALKAINDRIAQGANTASSAVSDVTKNVTDLNSAVANIPNNPYADWNVPAAVSDPSSYGSTGGMVMASGIQHFARGGRVLPFRGTDTVPAMLTPGEMVLTKAQQREAFGSSSGTTTIVVQSVLDGRVVSESVTQHQNNDYRRRRKVRAA
jgi:hypothetical protein